MLLRLMRSGRLARVPLLIDSPLAARIADVFRRYPHDLGLPDPGAADDFLGGPGVTYVSTKEESHELSRRREPCIVVASGGMCDAGRILNHIKRHVDDPRCSLVMVCFQAPNTLGAKLLEKGPTVRFHGRAWNKWIEVVPLDGLSGHADRDDFRALLGPAAAETGRVRLVHGEPAQAGALAETLRAEGFTDVAAPERGETVAVS
jgi:metallo-beta-lactamase family protein